jgi:hypothetical protein
VTSANEPWPSGSRRRRDRPAQQVGHNHLHPQWPGPSPDPGSPRASAEEKSPEARRAELQRPGWDPRHRDWGVGDTSDEWEADPVTKAGTHREKSRGRDPHGCPFRRRARVDEGGGHAGDQLSVARTVELTALAVALVMPAADFVDRVDRYSGSHVSWPTPPPVDSEPLGRAQQLSGGGSHASLPVSPIYPGKGSVRGKPRCDHRSLRSRVLQECRGPSTGRLHGQEALTGMH